MKKVENIVEILPGGISFEMVFVEGGEFMMGSEEEDAESWEKPIHEVNLDGFYIGKYPVTQALWKAVMDIDNNPSYFKGDNRPVEHLSWHDAKGFIKKLSKITNPEYRLLTESEWEYAARGGEKSKDYEYAGSSKLKDVGWYAKNSYGETKPVGLKYPNELGIYDMSGNVWEWVEDQWHDNYKGARIDGSAWVDLEERIYHVIRGGSWASDLWDCRVSYRNDYGPTSLGLDVGFRLGLSHW